MHTFSMVLTAFFTLRSFLNGNMVFIPVPNTLLNAISFPTRRRDIELDSHHMLGQ